MFLLGGGLFGIGRLLDVHNQLCLRLVLVHRASRVVHLIAINVEAACLPRSRPAEPIETMGEYDPSYACVSLHGKIWSMTWVWRGWGREASDEAASKLRVPQARLTQDPP